MGPVADSCHDALLELNERMNLALDNYHTLIRFFEDVSDEYSKVIKKHRILS